jgi:predicted glycoside hydrolase/deacetylase ChbG (UPF0249 family)
VLLAQHFLKLLEIFQVSLQLVLQSLDVLQFAVNLYSLVLDFQQEFVPLDLSTLVISAHDFDGFHEHLPQVKLDDMEVEFRAQIEMVLAAGLKPTHLDWHAIRFGSRTDIVDLMIRLAKEYGLALRVIVRSWIEKLQSEGLPTIDGDFLDSYGMDPSTKPARYAHLLRELPAGLSEWAIHPGLDNMELLALEPTGNHVRQTDFEFWTSQQAKEIVEEEGIILLDYRLLQEVWRVK